MCLRFASRWREIRNEYFNIKLFFLKCIFYEIYTRYLKSPEMIEYLIKNALKKIFNVKVFISDFPQRLMRRERTPPQRNCVVAHCDRNCGLIMDLPSLKYYCVNFELFSNFLTHWVHQSLSKMAKSVSLHF